MQSISLQADSAERRRFIRVNPEKTEPVMVEIATDDFRQKFKVLDISEVGVSLEIPQDISALGHELAVRQHVNCILHLVRPIRSNICLQAFVRQKSATSYGIEFRHLKPFHRKMIRGFVSTQLNNAPFSLRWRYKLGLVL